MALIDTRGPAVQPPIALAYAASLTPDAALANAFKVTATGNLTLNPPANGVDGFMMIVSVLASGGTRTVTIAAGIQLTTGQSSPVSIASGKVGYFGLRYSALSGNWSLLALAVEQ